ncbi:hypothetical protein LEMLEM_LOCUS24215 [Lemmus lemmus]
MHGLEPSCQTSQFQWAIICLNPSTKRQPAFHKEVRGLGALRMRGKSFTN